jgi:hypothetical protein
LRQQASPDRQQRNHDRQIDEEQPTPTKAQQQTAEQRAEQKRRPEHGTDQPQRSAAALERHRFRDDGRRDGHQTAGAKRLDRAADQQQRQRPCGGRYQ